MVQKEHREKKTLEKNTLEKRPIPNYSAKVWKTPHKHNIVCHRIKKGDKILKRRRESKQKYKWSFSRESSYTCDPSSRQRNSEKHSKLASRIVKEYSPR